MAYFNCTHLSRSLEKSTSFNIVIPENCKEDIPVIVLLHGLSDDYTMWMRRTSAERYADKYGVAIVMPDAGRSFYTNMKYGLKYYDYVSKEILEYVRKVFRITNKREKTFICGLSMGGYGALKIAMRNPEVFEAAVGMSSVADIVGRIKINEWKNDFDAAYGSDALNAVEGSDEDLFALVDKLQGKETKPRIFQICGTEDFMYEDNQRLKSKFEDSDFNYKYFEEKGTHCWEMWDKWLPLAIEFFLNK